MEKEVADDLSGDLKRIMISLINARRPESSLQPVNVEKARQEAKELLDAGVNQWGTLPS